MRCFFPCLHSFFFFLSAESRREGSQGVHRGVRELAAVPSQQTPPQHTHTHKRADGRGEREAAFIYALPLSFSLFCSHSLWRTHSSTLSRKNLGERYRDFSLPTCCQSSTETKASAPPFRRAFMHCICGHRTYHILHLPVFEEREVKEGPHIDNRRSGVTPHPGAPYTEVRLPNRKRKKGRPHDAKDAATSVRLCERRRPGSRERR